MALLRDFWVEGILMAGVFALLIFILRARMRKRVSTGRKAEKSRSGKNKLMAFHYATPFRVDKPRIVGQE